MAGCGQTPRQAASRRRSTLRGLRADAGASDDRTRVRAAAGAALSAVPPRGHAAAANGARRSRSGRRGSAAGGADRIAGEQALGRGPVPEVVHIAPARPEGRPRRARGRLRGDPVDKTADVRISVEVFGMVNLDMSADVDRRKGSKRRTTRSEALCRRCGKREAVSSRSTRKRRVNLRRRHDLCHQCRRALRDATRNPML